jgi:hypothetical protein
MTIYENCLDKIGKLWYNINMENKLSDYEEFTSLSFDEWDAKWKKEHPFLYRIDLLFKNKTVADYRASHAITHPWLIIMFAWNEVCYAWQRVFRGWDERVIWSIDWHLAEMIPLWMRQLKKDKHGVPAMCFKEDDCKGPEDNYDFKEGSFERAGKEYDDILEKIAVGFESYLAREEYKYKTDDEKNQLTKNFEEAFDLLKKYYGTFWD